MNSKQKRHLDGGQLEGGSFRSTTRPADNRYKRCLHHHLRLALLLVFLLQTIPNANATSTTSKPKLAPPKQVDPSTQAPSLIGRTTDAIVQVLSNVFARQEESGADQLGANSAHDFGRRLVGSSTIGPAGQRGAQAEGTTLAPPTTIGNETRLPAGSRRPRKPPHATSARPTRMSAGGRPTFQPHVELDLFRDEPSRATSTTLSTKQVAELARVETTTTTYHSSLEATTKRPTGSSGGPEVEAENATDSRQGALGALGSALRSIISFTEMTYLNRSTRVARGGDGEQDNKQLEFEGKLESSSDLVDLHYSASSAASGSPNRARPERLAALGNQSEAGQQQVPAASREHILFLCKLLHKQLEQGAHLLANGSLLLAAPASNSSASILVDESAPLAPSSLAPTLKTTTTTTTTTELPPLPRGLFVDHPSELNERHENLLLESSFRLAPQVASGGGGDLAPSTSDQREDQTWRLLGELFNLAARERALAAEGDEHDDQLAAAAAAQNGSLELGAGRPLVSLRLWSKSLRPGARLELVYWLLESVQWPRPPPPSSRLRVLGALPAGRLLDGLDHALVQSRLDQVAGLSVVQLVGPHRQPGRVADEPTPLVLDDSLAPTAPVQFPKANRSASPGAGRLGQQQQQQQETAQHLDGPAGRGRTGLHLLLDRLTSSSFSENFQLYLVAFLLLLLALILCLAVPLMCCKSRPLPVARLQRRRTHELGPKARQRRRKQLEENISTIEAQTGGAFGSLAQGKQLEASGQSMSQSNKEQQASEAIWRKLSNSTTTLVTDRQRSLQSESDEFAPARAPLRTSDRRDSCERLVSPRDSLDEPINVQQQQQKQQQVANSGQATAGERKWFAAAPKQTSLVVTERRQMTKSVQTYAPEPLGNNENKQQAPLLLACRDRLEARASDTLTKSELVMLKEKLIPIGLSGRQTGDYVNLSSQAVTRHIDSSVESQSAGAAANGSRAGPSRSVDTKQRGEMEENGDGQQCCSCCADGDNPNSCGCRVASSSGATKATRSPRADNQRRPKMSYLELPQEVQQIGSGLNATSRGQQQQQLAGSYKRYDVI